MIGFVLVLVFTDLFFASDFFISESKNQMSEICNSIKSTLSSLEKSSLNDYDEYLRNIDDQRNVQILIVNEDDQIVFRQNDMASKGHQSNKLYSRWSSAFHDNLEKLNAGEECYEVFTSKDDSLERVVLMSKLEDDYYLILSRSLISIQDNVHISNKFTIFIGIFIFVIGMILVFVFARSISNSITQINSVARSIANLDFKQKVQVKEKGEIGELADSINIISDKLNDSINSLKEDVLSREQLVRDMSHELKTPIAAVKGYAEGLKYGIASNPEKVEKYCNVIVSQCDEMDNLVRSMLNISKMNNTKEDVEKNTFLISEFNDSITESFEMKLLEKKINFITNDYEDKQIYANRLLMNQAVSNYMDNAIRCTPEGGIIRLNYMWEENGIKITVFNTGDRIDETELERLWNVFYKVDKSRTQNGTANYGVGLAIVKKVADIHKGRVWVENCDNGVLFGIFIPQ